MTMTSHISHRRPSNACRVVSLLAGALFAGTVPALEFECSVPGDTRYIRVELPGAEHLCEVTVEGDNYPRKTLWYANHDTLFCSAKAYELRDKYTDQWYFDCLEWPDRDGIDTLSESQRNVLDGQLKALIAQGRVAATPFRVTAVKAVSSAPGFDPTVLGLQFFRAGSTGTPMPDMTQLLVDSGGQWELVAAQPGLDSLVSASDPRIDVQSALISDITDAGALEITTLISPPTGASSASCYGNQVLQYSDKGTLVPVTPHRYVCDTTGLLAAE